MTTGETNRNPWNLKTPFNARGWQGQSGEDSRGHAIFQAQEWSARACIRLLRSYQIKRGLVTLNQIFAVYAPASDTQGSIVGAPANDPNEYARFVAAFLNRLPDDPLMMFSDAGEIMDKDALARLLEAMAVYENGHDYVMPDGVIEKGIELYRATA